MKKILCRLIDKTEKLIHRKIRYMILNENEFRELDKTLDVSHSFKIWG